MSSTLFQSRYRNNEGTAATTANSRLHAVNDARAIRIAEIMTDFRNLQHYLVQLRATPTAEEYYLEGYSLLRQCTSEAQTILQTPFSGSASSGSGDPESEKQQLRA